MTENKEIKFKGIFEILNNLSYLKKNKQYFLELVSYSEPALRNNSSVVEYCRTSMSALSGCTAGILGLTGLSGFVFYIFSVLALWVTHNMFCSLFIIFFTYKSEISY